MAELPELTEEMRATCRQQGRDLFAFRVEAITAARHGHPHPSLPPAATT